MRTCRRADDDITDITMYETLVRQHDCISYSAPTLGAAIARLQEIENRKIDRRHAQQEDAKLKKLAIANAKQAEASAAAEIESPALKAADIADVDAMAADNVVSAKRELPEDMTEDGQAASSASTVDQPPPKRVRLAEAEPSSSVAHIDANTATTDADAIATPPASIVAPAAPVPTTNGVQKVSYKTAKLESERLITTKPSPQIRGHTSYLTFAVLLPQEGT